MQTSFIVQRQDYKQCKFVESTLPAADSLAEGEVLLKIDKFSFTSNNVTYAMIGEKFGYWKFFPTQEGWGIIPVWGFADVVVSKNTAVQVGERFYGYYPMASHLLVKAGKVTPVGFLDVNSHRLELPVIYNYYTNTKIDAIYTPESEDMISIFRPLFVTSFLLDDFFADNQFFDSQHIILTGASSKTAIALAFLLHLRQKTEKNTPKIIGLTSKGNLDFVNSLNLYNQTLTYEQVKELPLTETYSIVDFAGNQELQYNLQTHLGLNLKYNCSVGMTHWDKNYAPEHKTSQKPILFFAPTHAQKRNQEWGADVFQAKVAKAWQQFIENTNQWLEVSHADTKEEIVAGYLELLAGKINPKSGLMMIYKNIL